MATVYKTFTKNDIENRNIQSVDASTKTAINTTLTNFVTYFKAAHS